MGHLNFFNKLKYELSNHIVYKLPFVNLKNVSMCQSLWHFYYFCDVLFVQIRLYKAVSQEVKSESIAFGSGDMNPNVKVREGRMQWKLQKGKYETENLEKCSFKNVSHVTHIFLLTRVQNVYKRIMMTYLTVLLQINL